MTIQLGEMGEGRHHGRRINSCASRAIINPNKIREGGSHRLPCDKGEASACGLWISCTWDVDCVCGNVVGVGLEESDIAVVILVIPRVYPLARESSSTSEFTFSKIGLSS